MKTVVFFPKTFYNAFAGAALPAAYQNPLRGETEMARGKDCVRCLYREMSDSQYARLLEGYIAHIPEEQKTPVSLYEERLARCKNCGNLINGMCRLCGCFVELRAAKIEQRCADTPEKW